MLTRRMLLGSSLALIAVVVGSTLTAQEQKAPKELRHYRAKQVMGAKVGLDGNSTVGVVDDIVLDEHGNVDYLIVALESKKLVTVPWDAADLDIEKRFATVHIAPQQFQKVPTYTVEQYPVFSAPTYRTQVYKYYGLTPGQERRVFKRGGAVVVP